MESVGRNLWSGGVGLSVVVAMTLVGGVIVRGILKGTNVHEYRFPIGLAAGAGVISLAMLIMGFLGLYGTTSGWVLVCAALAIGCFGAVQELRETFRGEERSWSGGRLAVVLGILLVSKLTLDFAMALLPPTALDALVYHLAIPAKYVAAGKIYPMDDPYLAFFSAGPFLVEELFTLGELLGAGAVGGVIVFGFFCAVLKIGHSVSRIHLGAPNGIIPVALIASVPAVSFAGSVPYNDVPRTLFEMAAVVCVLEWLRDPDESRRWLIFGGLSSGCAYGCKATAALGVAVLGLIVVFLGWRRGGLAKCLRSGSLFALAAAIAASPWMLKSSVWTGNPIHAVTTALAGVVEGDAGGMEAARWTLSRLMDFVVGLVRDLAFSDHRSGENIIGPAALAFLPLGWLIGRKLPIVAKVLLGYCGVYIVLGAVLCGQIYVRYLLTPVLFLVMLSGVFLEQQCCSGRLRAAWQVLAVAAFLSAGSVVSGRPDVGTAAQVLSGVMSEEMYLMSRRSGYPPVKYLNENAPSKARILSIGPCWGYYLRRDVKYFDCSTLGNAISDIRSGRYAYVIVNANNAVYINGERAARDAFGEYYSEGLWLGSLGELDLDWRSVDRNGLSKFEIYRCRLWTDR